MKKIISAVLAVAMMFSLVIIPTGANVQSPGDGVSSISDSCSHEYSNGVCPKCGKIDNTEFWIDKKDQTKVTEDELDLNGFNQVYISHKKEVQFPDGFVFETDMKVVSTEADHTNDKRWGIGFGFGDYWSGGIGFIYDNMNDSTGNFVVRYSNPLDTSKNYVPQTDALDQTNPEFGGDVADPVAGSLDRQKSYKVKMEYDAKKGYVAMYIDGAKVIEATDSRFIGTAADPNRTFTVVAYDQHITMTNSTVVAAAAPHDHIYENGVCTECGKIHFDKFFENKTGTTTGTEDLLHIDGRYNGSWNVTSVSGINYPTGFSSAFDLKPIEFKNEGDRTSVSVGFGQNWRYGVGYRFTDFAAGKGEFVLTYNAGNPDNEPLNPNRETLKSVPFDLKMGDWYSCELDYSAAGGSVIFKVNGNEIISLTDPKLVDKGDTQTIFVGAYDTIIEVKDAYIKDFACIHDWVPATCTEDGYCKICGDPGDLAFGHVYQCGQCIICHELDPNGSGLNHTWIDATCSTPKTCMVCGETEGEVNADAHSYLPATCQAPETCEYCGVTRGEKIEHDIVHNICKICGQRFNTAGTVIDMKFDSKDIRDGYKYFYSPIQAGLLTTSKNYEDYTWVMNFNIRNKVGEGNTLVYQIGKSNLGTAGYYFADKKFKITYKGDVLAESAEYDWVINNTNWVEMGVKVTEGNVSLYVDGVEVCKVENNDNFKGSSPINIRKDLMSVYCDYILTSDGNYDFSKRNESNADKADQSKNPTARVYLLVDGDAHDTARNDFLDLFKDLSEGNKLVKADSTVEFSYSGNTYYDIAPADSEFKLTSEYVWAMDINVKGLNVDETDASLKKLFINCGYLDLVNNQGWSYGYDFAEGQFFAGPFGTEDKYTNKFDFSTDEWHELSIKYFNTSDEDGPIGNLEIYLDGFLAFKVEDPDLINEGPNSDHRFMRVFNVTSSIKNMTYATVDYDAFAAHKGGTADCVKGAVCEGCGVEYTAVDPENHKDPKEATCLEDGYCAACNKKIAGKEAVKHHDFDEKGVCKVCGSLAGDVNGNGELEDKDIILILRLAGDLWKGVVVKDVSVAELTGDNIVNDQDAIILLRFSSNWKGIEFKSSEVKQIGDKPEAPTEPTTEEPTTEEPTTKPDPVPAA